MEIFLNYLDYLDTSIYYLALTKTPCRLIELYITTKHIKRLFFILQIYKNILLLQRKNKDGSVAQLDRATPF